MNLAIVAEGGGQRTIYAAGILDAFQFAEFNPFDLGIGASGGAQNLLSYFLELPGYAHKAIAELTMQPDFFVPYRRLRKQNVIDLDAYFERTHSDPLYQLPYQDVDRLLRKKELEFVATDSESLVPRYLVPSCETASEYLKASSAVPLLYHSGVEIDGRILIDGGVSDPLPVRRAWQRGARRIVVIRSVPETTTRTSWQQLYESPRLKRALPEKFTRMLEVHDKAYQAALAFIAEPPAGVEIRQIAPATSLASKAFGSRSLEIQADYGIGLRDGMMSLMPGPDSLRKWLGKPRSRERFGSPARDDQATSSTAH